MAEAMFSDQSGDVAGQFFRGLDAGQSFMERRQRMQWQREDRSREDQMRALTEPVYRAQLEAQRATAMSTLANTVQQENLRKQFAQESVALKAEYDAAIKLPTFEEQNAALERLQPRVSWFSNLPEGRGFVDAVNTSRTNAYQAVITNARAKGTLAEISARNEAERGQIILRGQQARETVGFTGEQQRMTNAARPRATDPAQRDAMRIRSLREQAVALQDTDPATAGLLFKRAEYLANPTAMSAGGGLDPSIFGPEPGAPTGTPPPSPVVTPRAATTGAPVAPAQPYRIPSTIRY